MRALPEPAYSSPVTFELCVSRLQNQATAVELLKLRGAVETAEKSYRSNAVSDSLLTIADPLVTDAQKTDELKHLYTGILSRKNSKVRYIYDAIKAAAKDDLCPLCAQRLVSTLDHYLEKARYPIFAVAPINLVPACSDCNTLRSRKVATSDSELTLHPYFDSVDHDIWLKANVLETDPIVVNYSAAPPNSWKDILRARMQSHFRTLQLGKLYSTHAGSELTGMRGALVSIANREGREGLRSYLSEQAASRHDISLNTWQGAMFAALAASDWFCGGGYESIPKPIRAAPN